MPFEVKGRVRVARCMVCGRLVDEKAMQFKTCCMNKPVVFCSRRCMKRWESMWLRRQEQLKMGVKSRPSLL